MSNKFIFLKKTPTHLINYCIYTGRTIPRSAMNKEHVIPKSLGGNASTRIFVDKIINSRFGSEIDGKIEKDFMISFGRRDADTRGHSNKKRIPEWRNAVQWKPTEKIGTGKGPYTLRFPEEGAKIFDPRTQTHLPHRVFNDGTFVVWDMEIDRIARFKFTLKTLLGVGWKLFREELIDALDVGLIRKILTTNVRLVEGAGDGGINFTDGFIDKSESGRRLYKRLEQSAVRKIGRVF